MADISYGGSFYFGSTNTPGQLAGLISLSMGGIEVNMIETKSLDQADKWKTFLAGFIDGGEVTAKLNWTSAAVTALMTALTGGLYYYKILLPSGSTLTGRALLKKNTPLDLPEDDRDTIDVTLQLSGAQTFTA